MITETAPTETDSTATRAPLIHRLRSIPIGLKFAAGVVTTIGILALGIGFGLSRLATQHLVQAKLRGAEVVVDSAAETLAPALDFADEAGVTGYAERLSRNRDISRVIVWNQTSTQPVFAKPEGQARAPSHDESRVSASEITLTRLLKNPLGQPVGMLEVAFSLRPENRYAHHLRNRILVLTGLLALAVAGLMIVIARFAIVLRLKQLLTAMIQLRNGHKVEVDASARDEIGELAHGFNEMALAIRDREQKLSIERDKSHELLDNMRQAILVVGNSGQVLDVRSREAELIFGGHLQETQIWTMLCDDSRPAIERQALREWIETAFSLGPTHWTRVAPLAPTEAFVKGRDGERHVLTIDTRPIVLDGQLVRIMFLCTDVTAQRQFEAATREREAEHDRQIRVMRALVSGSGLQLVATLRTIDKRLAACEGLLRAAEVAPGDMDELFQVIHSIKGDASAFELDLLVQSATLVEAELSNYRGELQHGETVASSWIKSLDQGVTRIAGALHATRAMVASASPLGEEILDMVAVRNHDLVALRTACANASQPIKTALNQTLSQRFGPLVQNLAQACERWAGRVSKKAVLEVRGYDVLVPDELAQVLPGVLTQLVRNAVSHGIEKPEARLSAGKDETGRIELSCECRDASIEIRVADDGNGLNEALLAAQVTRVSLTPGDAALQRGVTTADASTIEAGIAGRGVGLGAVQSELAKVGYSVQLNSVPLHGLEVRLYRSQHTLKCEGSQ
jgi:signal transduction histidine kinase